MADYFDPLVQNSEPARGQTDRFETYEQFGRYLRHQNRITSIVGGLIAFEASMFFMRSRLIIDSSIFAGILIGVPILSLLSWRYYFLRYSKAGYIEITDDRILRNIRGSEETYTFSTLRNVELPSKNEMTNGADFIYLYFGDGGSLELEKWMPNFPQIKHAIMRRIAIHPDLDFLRKRLSKSAAP